MVSSLSTSYPYKHDKLLQVGQGIDTSLFFPDAGIACENRRVILCVGRLSPVKDHATLISAVGLLRKVAPEPFRVVILGSAATARDDEYVRSLHQQVKDLDLDDIVSFEPAVSLKQLPAWYRRASVYVNMTPTGSGDKVVCEALACGVPSIVANEGFKGTLGIHAKNCVYDYGDAGQLTERLKWALSLSPNERSAMGAYFADQVEDMHGLNRLAQTLVTLFQLAKPQNDPFRDTGINPDPLRSKDA
jgi:glycosyltransferase involved in cell wall biosynthesis